jgi:hypothetical protein
VVYRAENQLHLEQMRKISEAVLEGLMQYQRAASIALNPELRPPAHGDLSPSNILIEEHGSNYHCFLVDFGVNHLYSHLPSSGLQHDVLYVAPEVTRDRGTPPRASADYFSLAQIMIELLGVPPNRDGTVPDLLYVWHPGIARLLEDLLDPDPVWRARLTAPANPAPPAISEHIAFEVEIAQNAREAPDFARGPARVFFFFWPLSGELGRQKRVHDALKTWRANVSRSWRDVAGSRLKRLLRAAWARQGSLRKPLEADTGRTTNDPSGSPESYIEQRLKAARSSYTWSWLWAVVLALGLFVVLYYIGLELNVPAPVPYWLELAMVNTPFGSLIHPLELPTYVVPDWRHNWPARLVAITYVLVAGKLYFNIYARLAPRGVPRETPLSRWAGLASLWMRVLPPFSFLLVMTATVIHSGLWPLATAVGQVGIAFGNLAVVEYLHRAYEVARNRPLGPSDVSVWSPQRANTQITGNDLVSGWVISSFVYTAVCVAVCVGIYTHKLVDVWLYACIVGFVNLFLLFVKKCGLDGPRIRIALTRADVAAERVSLRNAARPSHEDMDNQVQAVSPINTPSRPTEMSQR